MEDKYGGITRWMRMSRKTSKINHIMPRYILKCLFYSFSFYGGPLRGIINKLLKQKILQNVHTLILDGLSVTSDLLYDIIVQDSFSIRILSIREVKNLNEKKLRQALSYAVRPTRAENTPKLQALYIFGPRDPVTSTLPRRSQKIDYSRVATVPTSSIMHSQGAQIGAEWNQKSGEWLADNIEKQDEWYQSAGEVFIAREPPHAEWEATMRECEGIISFDAVLCRGPRHTDPVSETEGSPPLPWYKRQSAYLQPKAATCALEGCYGCGSAPEKFSEFGKSSLSQFPLLAPPPFHSSTQRACKVPFLGTSKSYFLARCVDCLRNRHCKSCHKWWCEECYEVPEIASTIRSFLQDSMTSPDGKKGHIKVHMGLCVESCLSGVMMSGAGSNGMWG